MGLYDDMPDVLPVAQAPMIYRAKTSYDNRQERSDPSRHFRENQAIVFARAIMEEQKFYHPAPYAPEAYWLTTLCFEALVLTQKEWDQKLADAYNKGVQAASRMMWKR